MKNKIMNFFESNKNLLIGVGIGFIVITIIGTGILYFSANKVTQEDIDYANKDMKELFQYGVDVCWINDDIEEIINDSWDNNEGVVSSDDSISIINYSDMLSVKYLEVMKNIDIDLILKCLDCTGQYKDKQEEIDLYNQITRGCKYYMAIGDMVSDGIIDRNEYKEYLNIYEYTYNDIDYNKSDLFKDKIKIQKELDKKYDVDIR